MELLSRVEHTYRVENFGLMNHTSFSFTLSSIIFHETFVAILMRFYMEQFYLQCINVMLI